MVIEEFGGCVCCHQVSSKPIILILSNDNLCSSFISKGEEIHIGRLWIQLSSTSWQVDFGIQLEGVGWRLLYNVCDNFHSIFMSLKVSSLTIWYLMLQFAFCSMFERSLFLWGHHSTMRKCNDIVLGQVSLVALTAVSFVTSMSRDRLPRKYILQSQGSIFRTPLIWIL